MNASSTECTPGLDWTGNHFLDEDYLRNLVHTQLSHVRLAYKGSPTVEPLRAAIARYYDLNPEWVAVGAGSSQVLSALVRGLPGDVVFDIVPNFHIVRMTSELCSRDYRPLPVRHPADLLLVLSQLKPIPRSSVLTLSSPRNPLGYSFPIEVLVNVLLTFPGIVVVDEAYAEFSETNAVPLVRQHANLIVVRTFSKAWGLANLRIGYALSQSLPPGFQTEFLMPYAVGELAQRVGCEILAHPEPIFRSIREAQEGRRGLTCRLAAIPGGYVWPSDANFVCFEHPEIPVIVSTLLERGVRTAELHRLRHYPNDWPCGLRITVARRATMSFLLETMEFLLGNKAETGPSHSVNEVGGKSFT